MINDEIGISGLHIICSLSYTNHYIIVISVAQALEVALIRIIRHEATLKYYMGPIFLTSTTQYWFPGGWYDQDH